MDNLMVVDMPYAAGAMAIFTAYSAEQSKEIT